MPEQNIEIVKILDFSFRVEEDLYSPDKESVFFIDRFIGFNTEKGLFNLIIKIIFMYAGTTVPIVDTEVQNVFRIKDLKSYIDNERQKIVLPDEILLNVISISIAHTRALLSKNLKGTLYNNLMIPILNPVVIANRLFSDYMPENNGPAVPVMYEEDISERPKEVEEINKP